MEDFRIILVDDSAKFRDALTLLFNSNKGYNLVASLPDAQKVVNAIDLFSPDLLLMDINMPEISGVEAVQQIRKKNKDLAIVMLTSFDDDENVFDSVCAGANGYLLKSTPPKDLLSYVQEVKSGGAPMSPSIARKVLKLLGRQKPEQTDFKLSKREKEVLNELVEGKSYKMIADELNISFETVHSHLKRIYKELQVNSSAEAVAKSFRSGLFKP